MGRLESLAECQGSDIAAKSVVEAHSAVLTALEAFEGPSLKALEIAREAI